MQRGPEVAHDLKDLENILGGLMVEVEEAWKHFDWKPFLANEINAAIERYETGYYEAQADPFGEAWKPLAEYTIRKKGHDTILVDSGRMKGSLTGRTGDSVVDVFQEGMNAGLTRGTSVEYAGYHQTGTKTIPQRAHVGLNEEKADQLAEFAADEAVRQLMDLLA
jgi:phage gpG-like protein